MSSARTITGLGLALTLGVSLLLAPAGAQAQETIEITGQVLSSPRIANDAINLSMCPVAGTTCITPQRDAAGAFSVVIAPDEWRIRLSDDATNESDVDRGWSWSMETTAVLTQDQNWALQLPNPSHVRVTTKAADGSAFAGVSVYSGGDLLSPSLQEPANDALLTPALPAFSVSGRGTFISDRRGIVMMPTMPDDDFTIVPTEQDGTLRYRLPLNTPTRTSVDAGGDVAVTARALPIRTVALRVRDYQDRTVPGYLDIRDRWGYNQTDLAATGFTTFRFPEGPTSLSISSTQSPWYLPASWRIAQPIDIRGDEILDLTLPRPVELRAEVTDQDTNLPRSGVRIDLGGPANSAVIGAGLAPAAFSNGSGYPLLRNSGRTKTDGGVEFRAFADRSLEVEGTLQEPGVYRTTPTLVRDASADTTFQVRLPRSATITLITRTPAGAELTGSSAQLRVGPEYARQFVADPAGRPQIQVSRGVWRVETFLRGLGRVDRTVDASTDRIIEYTLPDPDQRIRVLRLDENGRTVAGQQVTVAGEVAVGSDEGTIEVWSQFSGTTDARGLASISLPPLPRAALSINWWSTPPLGGFSIPGDDLVALQLRPDNMLESVPYAHLTGFDSPYVLQPQRDVAWELVAGDAAQTERRLVDVFGNDSGWSYDDGGTISGGLTSRAVDYPQATTTCVRVIAWAQVAGPTTAPLCRTRPVDDDTFVADGDWTRVRDANAYGNSYQQGSRRGSELRLNGVSVYSGWRPGGIAVVAWRSRGAGTIMLVESRRGVDRIIGRRVSLAGPPNGPQLISIPDTENVGVRGNLRVVVVSDGQPVRVDGLALPASFGPQMLFPGYE